MRSQKSTCVAGSWADGEALKDRAMPDKPGIDASPCWGRAIRSANGPGVTAVTGVRRIRSLLLVFADADRCLALGKIRRGENLFLHLLRFLGFFVSAVLVALGHFRVSIQRGFDALARREIPGAGRLRRIPTGRALRRSGRLHEPVH